MIYLDYNATTPCDESVLAAMLPYFTTKYGNAAATTYPLAWQADEAVKIARKQVAALVGAAESEIIFTSGATESINLALKGLYDLYLASRPTETFHIITCKTEHSAVLDTCKYLATKGAHITYLDVDAAGRIVLEDLKNAIQENTIMIAIMMANNETGVLQDIAGIHEIATERKIVFFSDTTQAVGKIPCDFRALGIDMACISAHKIYGPKGVGALYLSRKQPRVRVMAQQHGGGHENGMRSGTLNVPGIVGLGKACALSVTNMNDITAISKKRDKLQSGLMQIAGAKVNGSVEERLPNVLNIGFKGLSAQHLIPKISQSLALSIGSACNAADKKPSHVLAAMGLSEDYLHGSLRLSIGWDTSDADIETTIAILTNNI